MGKRWALGFLGVASCLILVACLIGGAPGAIGFAFLSSVFPAGLILVGISRRGRLGRAAWPVGLLVVFLVASVAAMIVLRGWQPGDRLLFGLPPALVVQLVGLLVAPLVIVGLGFAATFRHFGPSDGELDELRALAARRRES